MTIAASRMNAVKLGAKALGNARQAVSRSFICGAPRFAEAVIGNLGSQGEARMSSQNRVTGEFKTDAVAQVVDLGN